MNTLTYDDFNDLEKKKSGSDKKNMRDQIFDDIDLRESNPIGIGLTLTP